MLMEWFIIAAHFTLPQSVRIHGGGLPSVYKALQFHLHWGVDAGPGSEHTVDGEHYPMEVNLLTIISMHRAAGTILFFVKLWCMEKHYSILRLLCECVCGPLYIVFVTLCVFILKAPCCPYQRGVPDPGGGWEGQHWNSCTRLLLWGATLLIVYASALYMPLPVKSLPTSPCSS